ncbi:LpqN/LpqT family lipoprotein [Mycolicibacterium iranicum]|uniref:LpqN/LpqT family lipoprotein n=1 Tax=Mycolicibacterium iranicum TaxID=912594 RepID=A0ABT4HRK7_MYCIR|nr:LpqN/LpqT family lipoprotein [Mycolicibacterium iranicum]MCZ0732446.1 LpqN/LpqT family lipoprotein [Mycolicibacterium iranicum]
MTFGKRASTTIVAAILGIGLSACASDTSGEAQKATDTSASSTTQQSATSSPAAPPASQTPPAAAPGMTLDQYILDNNIDSSGVLKGEDGAPTITLPIPPGWEAAGPRAPRGAYDALVYTGPPPSQTPPTIVAYVVKLTGNVDPAKVLEYAANETRVLPGFQGANEGKPSTLANYEASQIGGFYTKDGVELLIAQKTVVIPAQDGLFVLKITAEGAEDYAMPLMDATAAIDEQTTITA